MHRNSCHARRFVTAFVVDDRVKRFDKVQRGNVVKATINQAKMLTLRKMKVKPNITVEETCP